MSDHMLSQQILDSIADRMLVLEADGTIALANLAWQQFAHRHDNLDVRAAGVGTNYLTLCRRAADLGSEIAQGTLDGVQTVLNGAQASFSFEYPYHAPALASSINEAQARSSFAYLYHNNLNGNGYQQPGSTPGRSTGAAHYRARQWFLLRATALIGSSGRVLVTYTDITDRKQAEQQMTESVEMLSTAEAVTHIGSWAWDLRSNRITWSDEMYRLFGVDRETFGGNLNRVFEQAIHPDDRARVRAANVRVITTQEPAPIEYRIVRPNGEIRVVFGDDRIIFDQSGEMIGIRGNIHDRTESRHIEDALRLDDQRLNALFELSQHAYDMSEHDVIQFAVEQAALLTSSTIGYLHFISADQQAIQMFAWSQATVDHSSMEYKTHYHTHYHVAWAEVWADCIRSGRPVAHNDYASLPSKPDLPNSHVSLTRHLCVPMLDSDSKVVMIIGVGNKPSHYDSNDIRQVLLIGDSLWKIVQRKRAEEELRDREQRFRTLFEQAATGIARISPDGQFLEVNQQLCKIVGYPYQILIQKQFQEITYPDDLDTELGYVQQLLAGEIATYNMEKRYLHAHGGIVWVNLTVSLVRSSSDDPYYFIAIIEDITAHKQVEMRLLQQSVALESAANAIVITDRDGIIQWINPAFTQLTGYSSAEVIGRDTRLLKSGRQSQAFYQNLWNTIISGQVWQGELINQRRDGQFYDEEQTITPVRDSSGQVQSFIAIKQDITARKRREREQQAIMTISSALRAASSQAGMVPIVADTTRELLNAHSVLLAMQEPDTLDLRITLALGNWSHLTGQRYSIHDSPLAEVLAATDRPYIGPCPWQHAAETAPESPLVLMGVPIRMADRPGILLVGRNQPFDETETEVLTAIADITANAMHRAMSHEQTLRHLHRIRALHRIDHAITSSAELDITLQIILSEIATQLGADAANALVIHEPSQTMKCLATHGLPPRQLGGIIHFGEDRAGMAVLQRRLVIITDLSETLMHENAVRHPATSALRTCHMMPLIAKGIVKGVLELYYHGNTKFATDWETTLDAFANQAAIAIDNADLFDNLQRSNSELRRAYDTTIEGWSHALDLRDKQTEGHTLRVTAMTLRLAMALGVPDDELVHIRRGALLHDIGKMGVPDQILLKPGPLTDEEWVIMRKHPTYAYEMLAPIDFLKPALDIPYYHHEQWDGSGYPCGLRGDQIPLAARIFAVIDVWDALISDRPYREGWPIERVIAYLLEGAGSFFDPQIVTAFLELLEQIAPA